MITLERFEHELLKLKTQFPADHVGHGRGCTGSELCLVGQIARNIYGETGYLDQDNRWQYHGYKLSRDIPLAAKAMNMNDDGYTWHEIIDALVPGSAIRVSEAIGSSASPCDPGMPGGMRETDLPAPEERPDVEQDEPAEELVGV